MKPFLAFGVYHTTTPAPVSNADIAYLEKQKLRSCVATTKEQKRKVTITQVNFLLKAGLEMRDVSAAGPHLHMQRVAPLDGPAVGLVGVEAVGGVHEDHGLHAPVVGVIS